MIGRGYGFPVALEWALKLKELAGVYAEPFSAADYRHGPIALASAGAPAFTIDLGGAARSDVRRLGQDLLERGARLIRASEDSNADLCLPGRRRVARADPRRDRRSAARALARARTRPRPRSPRRHREGDSDALAIPLRCIRRSVFCLSSLVRL